jgi:rRNA maturation endonuclease Nob1
LEVLNDLRTVFVNCRSANGTQARDAYVLAVERTEAQFLSLFWDPTWVSRLHSEEYWRIREITGSTYRPSPLVHAEVERVLVWIEEEARTLEWLAMEEKITDPDAMRAVLDTNVFLHYLPLTDVPWPEVLGSTRVRIVVPIRVISELDEHKNRGGKRGDRAGKRLKMLQSLTVGKGRSPLDVRANTTLQILLHPPNHMALPQADAEILMRASYLAGLPGGQVCLVTGDLSMQMRAESSGLKVLQLGDEYRLTLDSD